MNIPMETPAIFYEAITEALYKEQNKKTALLLRNHVETYLQRVRKWGGEYGLLHRDLEIARNVQKASFPQQSPAIPGLRCASFYRPAHTVGGDYYDFLPLEDGAWGIAIGDVSGKGIGAALVMATLQASLRAQTLRPRSTIETLMKNVNRLLRESSPAEFFASLFYAEYQPAPRLLRYVNAGHNPPVVVRRSNGRCRILALHSGGVPVGALEESHYESETIQLEAGDVVVGYTDGVTESENVDGSAFGQEHLKAILCDCRARDPQDILQHIVDELSAHSAGCSQADDVTLVVMRVETE